MFWDSVLGWFTRHTNLPDLEIMVNLGRMYTGVYSFSKNNSPPPPSKIIFPQTLYFFRGLFFEFRKINDFLTKINEFLGKKYQKDWCLILPFPLQNHHESFPPGPGGRGSSKNIHRYYYGYIVKSLNRYIVNRPISIVQPSSSIVHRQSSIVNRQSSIVHRPSSIANRQ